MFWERHNEQIVAEVGRRTNEHAVADGGAEAPVQMPAKKEPE